MKQVAQFIVGVLSGLTVFSLTGEFAIGGVGIGGAVVVEQAVLGVICGGDGAVDVLAAGAVAVGVELIHRGDGVVFFDLIESSSEVVAVVVDVGDTGEGFGFAGDAAEGVAVVLHLV